MTVSRNFEEHFMSSALPFQWYLLLESGRDPGEDSGKGLRSLNLRPQTVKRPLNRTVHPNNSRVFSFFQAFFIYLGGRATKKSSIYYFTQCL